MKSKVVVDASFWINVVFLELDGFLLDYFDLIFVSKVKSEICEFKKYDYFYLSKDIKIFEQLLSDDIIKIQNPKSIPKKYISELEKDSGELYTLSLAKEKKYGVLIDDGNPYDFCKNENIIRMNTIDFIIFLYIKNELTRNKAIDYIRKLNYKIKDRYIEKAIVYLKNLE